MFQNEASESNSPRLGFSQPVYDVEGSDDEQQYSEEHADNEEFRDSWSSSGNQAKGKQLNTAASADVDTPGDSTPSTEGQDGMLARDMQRKTAYYDYAAEKQLSQADAKLFYQRSQLELQRTGENAWGSQQSPQQSPVLRARTFSSVGGQDQEGLKRSTSINSMQSGVSMSQK